PFKTANGRSSGQELNILLQKGFSRVLFLDDAEVSVHRIDDLLEGGDDVAELTHHSGAYLLIDRLVVKADLDDDDMHRIADSVQTAFYESEGACFLYLTDDGGAHRLEIFNNRFEADGITFEEPSPNFFSYNN